MRLLKKISLLIFLLLCAGITVNYSCTKKKWFKYITYEGTVYDTIGGVPASNIQVSLAACNPGTSKDECDNFTVGYVNTGASGHFRIHERAARSDRYQIIVGSKHYSSSFKINGSELEGDKYKKLYLK